MRTVYECKEDLGQLQLGYFKYSLLESNFLHNIFLSFPSTPSLILSFPPFFSGLLSSHFLCSTMTNLWFLHLSGIRKVFFFLQTLMILNDKIKRTLLLFSLLKVSLWRPRLILNDAACVLSGSCISWHILSHGVRPDIAEQRTICTQGNNLSL